ncbi:ABC transporter substrate-binding protein [Mesorhizobium denitrificans]|uniref:ABC transporter substrate-binding protein n=2 Tax=Phyllobacteriaceae TaxID=69277 RepID=A0A371XI75_9HYPH|nr:ABC transporter substrate-binding protein [Mesorhizobium denitrificans]
MFRPRGILVSAALVAALGGAAHAESRTLVIARDMDINSLDPHRAWCDTCQIFNSSAYESLVTLDKDNKIIPLLAKSWEVNPEQTQITLHLDPAAKFSDGSAVESKDVKWTFERLKNIKTSSSFMADPITSIEIPDAQTVVLKLASPNSEYIQILAASYMAVMNSDVVAEHGGLADATAVDKDTAETWLLANSAGSGTFVLSGYEPNAELRLKRNDTYWGANKAKVPEVVFRQVKDAVAQAQMLQSGTVDIAQQIDPETAKSLQGSAAKVEELPSLNFVYVVLSPGAKGNKVPLTPQVREAISSAIDRKGLIDLVVGGAGSEIAVPVPPGFPGAEGHKVPEYNPEHAKKLLADAGHPDGFEIESIYPDMNTYGVDFNLMMQKVQQDLAQVGIKVKLSPVPFSNWRDAVNGDGIPLSMVFYAPDFFGTSQYIDYFGLAPGTVWAKRAGGERDPSIVNHEIRGVMDAALAAKTPEEAAKKWFDAAEMIKKADIILPMINPSLVLAYGPNVKGVRFSPCCNTPLAEISNDN